MYFIFMVIYLQHFRLGFLRGLFYEWNAAPDTFSIPTVYTLIPSVLATINTLARLVLGYLYDLAADPWMFPPGAEYSQYASSSAST